MASWPALWTRKPSSASQAALRTAAAKAPASGMKWSAASTRTSAAGSRAIAWRQWKRGRTRYAALRRRGVGTALAAQTAGCPHGPWRLSNSPALAIGLPNAFCGRLGLASLAPAHAAVRDDLHRVLAQRADHRAAAGQAAFLVREVHNFERVPGLDAVLVQKFDHLDGRDDIV